MNNEQPTNADILRELRQLKTEVGQISDEVGQLKKGQTAIQISIARFDEKFDGVENRFDALENQIGKVESGVERLEVAVNGNTTAIARMDGESTAMSALFWTGAAVVVAVVITTIIENKFHWLKNNWGWMFGNKEIRK